MSGDSRYMGYQKLKESLSDVYCKGWSFLIVHIVWDRETPDVVAWHLCITDEETAADSFVSAL